MKIFVTGSSGFIGAAVVKALIDKRFSVIAANRKWSDSLNVAVSQIFYDLEDLSTISNIDFTGVDCVIHCAAYSHYNDRCNYDDFIRVNRDASIELARVSAKQGVKRFIFLSSVKVNGESTLDGLSFTPSDRSNPHDVYARSKYEAEIGLLKISRNSDLEIVIIRIPLVYGPGVKGNFLSIVNLIKKGVPLPFLNIHNKRSFLALDNLIDFLVLCIDATRSRYAANQIFLCSDGENISTGTLIKRIAKVYGIKKPRLFNFPVFILKLLLFLSGKKTISDRLTKNLSIDITKNSTLLDWQPVTSMDEQLTKMIRANESI